MSIENRADAAAQDLEGKGQEAIGKVTGDRQDQGAGKAKQVGADIRTGLEDAKDNVAEAARKVGNKIEEGVDRLKEDKDK